MTFNFSERLRHFVFFLLALSFDAEVSASFYCKHVVSQLGGVSPYRGPIMQDKERIGDIALENGILYLALSVPIARLPDILVARYLPHLELDYSAGSPDKSSIGFHAARRVMMQMIHTSQRGKNVDIDLGGLDLFGTRIEHTKDGSLYTLIDIKGEPVDPESPLYTLNPNPGARPNHNALLLFSPRVLSLSHWVYGLENVLRHHERSSKESDGLCHDTYCYSSSSSDKLLAGLFSSHTGVPYAIRMDGPIPTYEIMDILIQPSNVSFLSNTLKPYPGLHHWATRIIVTDTYPRFDPRNFRYHPGQLRAVAEDINPKLKSSEDSRGVVSSPVMSFSEKFPAKVREIISTQYEIDTIPAEAPKSEDAPVASFGGVIVPSMFFSSSVLDFPDADTERFGGISDREEKFLDRIGELLSHGGTEKGIHIPKLLEGAKIVRLGKIEINAVREWKFFLAEYRDKHGSTKIVLIPRPDRFNTTGDANQPYPIWGIGQITGRVGESIEWEWTWDG